MDKLSGGLLAYVYLPNTGQPGYASFNRYYFSQQDRKGVVIDERYNGGGSAADYMIEVMQRSSTATSTTWPATACRSAAPRPASGAQR